MRTDKTIMNAIAEVIIKVRMIDYLALNTELFSTLPIVVNGIRVSG